MKCVIFLSLLLSTPTAASETIAYSYDPTGRLAKVSRSGSVNNGVKACYAYDAADNRSNVTVTDSDCSPPGMMSLSSPSDETLLSDGARMSGPEGSNPDLPNATGEFIPEAPGVGTIEDDPPPPEED